MSRIPSYCVNLRNTNLQRLCETKETVKLSKMWIENRSPSQLRGHRKTLFEPHSTYTSIYPPLPVLKQTANHDDLNIDT